MIFTFPDKSITHKRREGSNPSHSANKKRHLVCLFLLAETQRDKYAAIYCRRSHLSVSENPAEGLPLAGNGCIPFSSFFMPTNLPGIAE